MHPCWVSIRFKRKVNYILWVEVFIIRRRRSDDTIKSRKTCEPHNLELLSHEYLGHIPACKYEEKRLFSTGSNYFGLVLFWYRSSEPKDLLRIVFETGAYISLEFHNISVPRQQGLFVTTGTSQFNSCPFTAVVLKRLWTF